MSWGILMAAAQGVEKDRTHFTVSDSVIEFFPLQPENARIVHEQVGEKPVWIDAFRESGKTRQIRIQALPKDRSVTVIQFKYPFGDDSATWNLPAVRKGNLVTATMKWNQVLIGDLMDVNEGNDDAVEARKKLGAETGDAALSMIYSSGDSISLVYWPYLEASLAGTANVYYQQELGKDLLDITIRNNGHANLAYGILEKAYGHAEFKPKYLLVNFGLHMIAGHKNRVQECGQWIEKFDDLARKKGALLVWVNTTPYQESFRPTENKTIAAFNRIAAEIALKRGIPVIDIHALVKRAVAGNSGVDVFTDGVHFSTGTKQEMGRFLAEEIKSVMKAVNE